VGEALEEALLNAMYHGNLEITERELAESRAQLDDGPFQVLVAQRMSQEAFRNRKVLLLARICASEVRFVIRDEGAGFNVAAIQGSSPAQSFEHGRNRGLTLIQALMDDVRFNSQGNELTISKRNRRPVSVPA
jgi:hypothetical protein